MNYRPNFHIDNRRLGYAILDGTWLWSGIDHYAVCKCPRPE
jgi:hypothetical protein